MTAPTLVILAAGEGRRSGGFKLSDPVGPFDETIVEYSIYDARRAGFGKTVFVIRREFEQRFKDAVAARNLRHFPIEYVFQDLTKIPHGHYVPPVRTKPWGTTHAILMAAPVIHEPFAVINVGELYGAEGYRHLAQHLQAETSDHAMVGFVLRNTLYEFGTAARGVCQVSGRGYLEGIQELKNVEREGGHAINTDAQGRETRLSGDEIVSMNMWGFTPEVFGKLQESFESFLKLSGSDTVAECSIPNSMNDLVRAEKAHVKVLRCSESWLGINYREDYSRVVASMRRLIESGYYPKKLW
jgi:NDP-sugar pyrophosphorylase family protein